MTNLNQETIQWAGNYLSSHGYTLQSELPEDVIITPWSYVARFATSQGYIYLKQTPKLLALEAGIIQILHDQFHASVPEVIAHYPEFNCFLMKDAGRPLREILKKQFDTALFCQAIDQFTSLQLATADHVNVFLDIGVPDWRLDKIPALYLELLLQKDILVEDGLSEIEMNTLKKLFPQVCDLCQKLSDCSIKATIVQPDFNDNNTLIDELSQAITIIDLGEIVISHPFLSLLNCLQQINVRHGLTVDDHQYVQLKNACLKNYINCYDEKQVFDAFAAAQSLWSIYGALGQYRLRMACDTEQFLAFQRHGRLSGSLKEFMGVCHAMGKLN